MRFVVETEGEEFTRLGLGFCEICGSLGFCVVYLKTAFNKIRTLLVRGSRSRCLIHVNLYVLVIFLVYFLSIYGLFSNTI